MTSPLPEIFRDASRFLSGRRTARRLWGDCYEIALRGLVRDALGDRLRAARGLLFDEDAQKSRELDVILFPKATGPLFDMGDELVVVRPRDALAAIQVKGFLTNGRLDDAAANLSSARKLNPHLKTYVFVVTFSSRRQIGRLVKEATRAGVDGIFGIWESPSRDAREVEDELGARGLMEALGGLG